LIGRIGVPACPLVSGNTFVVKSGQAGTPILPGDHFSSQRICSPRIRPQDAGVPGKNYDDKN
jgi:hypothetical protein